MSKLLIISTPIGNLGDITLRTLSILKEIKVIAAESILSIRRLLSALDIKDKKLISCRESNRFESEKRVINMLSCGYDVGLVSDAGTPCISDPGMYLVHSVVKAGYIVSPLPGASALTAALSVSGYRKDSSPVIFTGFLPRNKTKRYDILQKVKNANWTITIFESPNRIIKTLNDILKILGDRFVTFTRELTKINEEIKYTTLTNLIEQLCNLNIKMRGEITLVIDKNHCSKREENCYKKIIVDREYMLDFLLWRGMYNTCDDINSLVRKVSYTTKLPRNQVYEQFLKIKRNIKNKN